MQKHLHPMIWRGRGKLLLLLSTHQTLGALQLGLSLLETQASSLIVYTPNPGVCYVSPCDFATGTISSGNTRFFSYCLHTKPWGLLTLQLGLSPLETQASSLIVYTPNPGVCYVSPCDFANGIISSGNTSFFFDCIHTKPWGLLCSPL